MIANRPKRSLSLVIVTIVVLAAAGGDAQAATPPVKLEPASPIASGFEYPEGVAVAPDGNIYVADRGNNRVQELTPAGEFVLMFGEEVNETTKGDICTEEEVNKAGVKCKAGVAGSNAGALADAESVAVDPSTGDVYVQDVINWRVEEFTAAGQFVLTFGKEVNETTRGDICTEEEIAKAAVKCKVGIEGATGGSEHGAFGFAGFYGGDLAVGPAPEHLLYVGDEQRVQEFNAQGNWKGEIPLSAISAEPESRVRALAVDQTTGEVYLAYATGPISSVSLVRVFNAAGEEQRSFEVAPLHPGAEVNINAMALDPQGHLAVAAYESGNSFSGPFGSLFEAGSGHLITGFSVPGGSSAMAFNEEPEAELYAASDDQVTVYRPVSVAELLANASTCKAGPANRESSATLDCGLNGTVNPEGVPGTEAWFEWGRTPSLGEATPRQVVGEAQAVSAAIEGVRPNEQLYARVAGYDQNVQPPERQLTSETVPFTTPAVPPRVLGEPSAPFVRSASAVIFGELNPENANTRYEFQYGECRDDDREACPESPYSAQTPVLESPLYGKIGTTSEVTGLQPATTYHYRLVANNEHEGASKKIEGGEEQGKEGVFTTAPAPIPQAMTGSPSAIGATSALISGAVDPDGQPATYTFELGVYASAVTQYGVVFSGPAGTSALPTGESLTLTGLQPGTTYAYRIAIKSGYTPAGEPVLGAPMLFTTGGLPSALVSPVAPAMLALPDIAFPPPTAAPKTPSKQKTKQARRPKPRRKAKGS